MDALRGAKITVRSLHILIWIFIGLVVAGPALGFLTLRLGTQNTMGFAVDLEAIRPQMESIFSPSKNPVGSHKITVPVLNRWLFTSRAGLALTVVADGKVVYQTEPSSIELRAFQDGHLNLMLDLSIDLLREIQGKKVTIGGELGFGAPTQLWSVKLKFP